ncbi:MAG: amidohydrolase family protein [Rhodospirillaceae bacterium]|jgi:predicted TIM-barrel fold metal-dependent hydrolase|nr:amidohydrolase family protein [Rhodospirillaceae bacterium]MBT4938512.1 amidohydrolase family protein [Rhodospirillaceae bacterium]MBT5941531.1 amidohydrolase family protein [Rhodospirillaceae bacterium]MBT7268716.1 amidohydrolase family protein [Rhodospirillaceae bacterium]
MAIKLDAAGVNAKVDHPIVDGDAHVLEARLTLLDYVKKIAGPEIALKFENMEHPWKYQDVQPIFWGMPSGAHSIDRATAMLPKLFKERLDEAGIDVGIVYSTACLPLMHVRDDELRQVGHRALNHLLADIFNEVGDRLIPNAVIPMFSPEEAIAELDHAVNELGFKAAVFGTEVRLPIPEVAAKDPDLAKYTQRIYPVALDALHDYDPVWQRCMDLKIPVGAHTACRGGGARHSSPSNFVFNHLGGFATAGNYFCRSIFMDGVTRRFPDLNFAFLEGGVGWAAQLYNDLFEHWEKRNYDFMVENLDPAKLDEDLIREMADKYGGGILNGDALLDERKRSTMGGFVSSDVELDEFRRCEITKKEDIRDLFVDPFYFGCEADDAMNAVAFNTKINHFGAKLKAFFGSDIGHWDVEDMRHCVPDAYKNVAKGLFTEDDFRDFMYTNPVELYTRQNPDFFKGTVIEDEVSKTLSGTAKAA